MIEELYPSSTHDGIMEETEIRMIRGALLGIALPWTTMGFTAQRLRSFRANRLLLWPAFLLYMGVTTSYHVLFREALGSIHDLSWHALADLWVLCLLVWILLIQLSFVYQRWIRRTVLILAGLHLISILPLLRPDQDLPSEASLTVAYLIPALVHVTLLVHGWWTSERWCRCGCTRRTRGWATALRTRLMAWFTTPYTDPYDRERQRELVTYYATSVLLVLALMIGSSQYMDHEYRESATVRGVAHDASHVLVVVASAIVVHSIHPSRSKRIQKVRIRSSRDDGSLTTIVRQVWTDPAHRHEELVSCSSGTDQSEDDDGELADLERESRTLTRDSADREAEISRQAIQAILEREDTEQAGLTTLGEPGVFDEGSRQSLSSGVRRLGSAGSASPSMPEPPTKLDPPPRTVLMLKGASESRVRCRTQTPSPEPEPRSVTPSPPTSIEKGPQWYKDRIAATSRTKGEHSRARHMLSTTHLEAKQRVTQLQGTLELNRVDVQTFRKHIRTHTRTFLEVQRELVKLSGALDVTLGERRFSIAEGPASKRNSIMMAPTHDSSKYFALELRQNTVHQELSEWDATWLQQGHKLGEETPANSLGETSQEVLHRRPLADLQFEIAQMNAMDADLKAAVPPEPGVDNEHLKTYTAHLKHKLVLEMQCVQLEHRSKQQGRHAGTPREGEGVEVEVKGARTAPHDVIKTVEELNKARKRLFGKESLRDSASRFLKTTASKVGLGSVAEEKCKEMTRAAYIEQRKVFLEELTSIRSDMDEIQSRQRHDDTASVASSAVSSVQSTLDAMNLGSALDAMAETSAPLIRKRAETWKLKNDAKTKWREAKRLLEQHLKELAVAQADQAMAKKKLDVAEQSLFHVKKELAQLQIKLGRVQRRKAAKREDS